LLVQRKVGGSIELGDETSGRIDRERGGGQSLEGSVQNQLGAAMDHDFSKVRVHTSPGADALNREMGAKAFTTGRDIYFREGAYDPHSTSGRELIAHELTHVVQQSSGAVPSTSGKMTVNDPDDEFEKEADAVAKAVTNPNVEAQLAQADVQRQAGPEEEEDVIYRQEIEEEDESIFRQESEEEEDLPLD
jgi:hypothetical protein